MARDFRPKSARSGAAPMAGRAASKAVAAAAASSSSTQSPANGKKKASAGRKERRAVEDDEDSQSSSGEDEGPLLDDIRAMGGDEEDLELVRKTKGKSTARGEDNVNDVSICSKYRREGIVLFTYRSTSQPHLNSEVLSFMKELNFKSASGKDALPEVAAIKANNTPSEKMGKEMVKPKEKLPKVNAVEDKKSSVKTEKKKFASEKDTAAKIITKSNTAKVPVAASLPASRVNPATELAKAGQQSKHGFLVQPTSRWCEIRLQPLDVSVVTPPSAEDIAILQQKGAALLNAEKSLYAELNRSGKRLGPGMLSSSDAKFISELLAPGAKGGTLSDRVAALTMLANSSPIHNVDAMETLLNMAGKKGREESGRATRALADWLASGGGLGQQKLRYLRDHPSTSRIAQLLHSQSTSPAVKELADSHLLLAVFEDKLKRFYFNFIQILETQSHDTLPFVRKQAVTQIYLLLKEKSEQEQNLLRLLVNKLGDSDRAVASKASSSLLNILTVHPNMKAVISSEVSDLILKPSGNLDSEGKAKFNSHARYYGILTLNQTMLTSRDAPIANRLVTLYFELFETVLNEMNKQSGGKEEDGENGEEEGAEKPKKQKQRWRDSKGKKSQKNGPAQESKVIQDGDAKTMAAILAGVRRALPFASIDAAILDKHMSTLFRITHSSTFNISLQALQLIYQVSLSDSAASSSSQAISTAKVEDRFYRALYASLLDPRLATTSKQAMYLNLLFKAIKTDGDNRRVKAFVKRFVQTFNYAEPPWICGGLYLLGELVTALPGLRTLLEEPEDEGEEHYVDAVEEDGEEGKAISIGGIVAAAKVRSEVDRGYDALKREAQYAKAETTCLWEIVPLLFHFHPSVSLHARQLLAGEKITSSADLTLNTLSHFLDRFVYRNPKKNVAQSKGSSIMQPAVNFNDGKAGIESGVVKLRGVGIRQAEFVNDERFWKKRVQEVPVDQLFFHKYFNQKLDRSGVVVKGSEDGSGEDESDGESTEGEDEDGLDEDEEDSEDEAEIWKAMKRTMPRAEGDDELLEGDDDEEDDEEMMALMAEDRSDGESEGKEDDEDEDEDDEDSDAMLFDEDEDDLVSVDFEEDGELDAVGKKRKLEEDEDIGAGEKSKSQLRREERKRRKALPTFASAEDYAHLLGKSDDEDEEGEDGD